LKEFKNNDLGLAVFLLKHTGGTTIGGLAPLQEGPNTIWDVCSAYLLAYWWIVAKASIS